MVEVFRIQRAEQPPQRVEVTALDAMTRCSGDMEIIASVTVAAGGGLCLGSFVRYSTAFDQQKEKTSMPRYLIQASYTSDAAAAFVSKPQDRTAGVQAIAEKMGGKLHSLDFSLGEYDVVIVAELPDDTSAAAVSLAVNAAGHLKSYKTTRLLSPKEFLEAQEKAHGASYKAPSKG